MLFIDMPELYCIFGIAGIILLIVIYAIINKILTEHYEKSMKNNKKDK